MHAKTRAQQIARKAHIAHLAERGWTVQDIANDLGVSVPCVQYHLRALEQMWLEQIFRDISLIKARKAAELAAVKKAAWRGYDASSGETADDAPDMEVEDVLSFFGVGDPSKEEPEEGYDLDEPDPNPLALPSAQPSIDRKYPIPTSDDLPADIDPTAGLIRSTPPVEEIHKKGVSSSDFSVRRKVLDGASFQQFKEDGERRLAELRERKATSTPIHLQPRKGLRPRGRPAAGGDPAYLRVVLDAIKSEKDMLGLDAPKKFLGLRISPEDLRGMDDEQLDKMIAKLGGPEILEALESSGRGQMVVSLDDEDRDE